MDTSVERLGAGALALILIIGGIMFKENVKYIVTKSSDDMSLQKGDHIQLYEDGTLICFEAGGWLEPEDIESATAGAEFEIDVAWVEKRIAAYESKFAKLRRVL